MDLLLANRLDDHTFAPLAIELRVENLLPWPQIQLPVGDWQDHLMVHDKVLEMGFAVILARPMMAIVPRGGKATKPLLDVFDETGFKIVNVDGSGNVHCADEAKSFLDARALHQRRDFSRDANELFPLLGLKGEIVGG